MHFEMLNNVSTIVNKNFHKGLPMSLGPSQSKSVLPSQLSYVIKFNTDDKADSYEVSQQYFH